MKPGSKRSVLFVLLVVSAFVIGRAQDVAGSKDHPLITRYPGSVITWFDVQEFNNYKIATGPVTGYRKIDEWTAAAGKITRINYVLSGTRTITEVYANYLAAVRKEGFEVVAEGVHGASNTAGEIGGRKWLGVFYAENPFPASVGIDLLSGSATSGGSAYVAAKLKRPSGTVYVSLGGTQYTQDQVVFLLDVIEEKRVEDDLLHIDADAMGKSIEQFGKVALYGIFFDFDKAIVKPESKPTLEEITRLLKSNPALNLHIVGHTDMKGTLDYNMKLSKDRAAAVVNVLTADYGIALSRLEAHGVGPLVPSSTNGTEEGRSQNRRVELVER